MSAIRVASILGKRGRRGAAVEGVVSRAPLTSEQQAFGTITGRWCQDGVVFTDAWQLGMAVVGREGFGNGVGEMERREREGYRVWRRRVQQGGSSSLVSWFFLAQHSHSQSHCSLASVGRLVGEAGHYDTRHSRGGCGHTSTHDWAVRGGGFVLAEDLFRDMDEMRNEGDTAVRLFILWSRVWRLLSHGSWRV